MISPINKFKSQINKATEIAILGIRMSIHSQRAKKFHEIDLRKYRSRPKDKQRIRDIIFKEGIKSRFLITQMMIQMRQRIPRFELGTEIIAEINYKSN